MLGQVDEKYIEEAAPGIKAHKKLNWIKWGAMAACLCIVICAVTIPLLLQPDEVVPGDLVPMVFVNDTIYYQSKDQESFTEIQGAFDYIGKIESEVSPSQKPNKELQANHSIVGAEVYQYESNIVVLINDRYWLYVAQSD